MERLKYQRIAIDFDGTIAYNAWPEIGEFLPHAVRVMKKIKAHGGSIIIWTCRTGEQAEQVKQKLLNAGVEYDTFNADLPETLAMFPEDGRKVWADQYLDDRANFLDGDFDWLWAESKLFVEVEEGAEIVQQA